MHSVELPVTASEAIDLKNQLLAQGLVIDVDFAWRYHPNRYDSEEMTNYHSYVCFTFAKEEIATFYRLKWLR